MANSEKLINSFEGGLNTDSAPERQEPNTYRYLLNGVEISIDGDMLKLTNEKGTLPFSNIINLDTINVVNNIANGDLSVLSPIDINYTCIGKCVLNTDIILFLTDDITSKIGIVDIKGNYTTKISETSLGFNKNYPIQAEARILFNSDRVVYFTDNFNVIRTINLDKPYTSSNSKLFPDVSLPIIELDKINDGTSGKLYAGVYQFAARYLNGDLSKTTFGYISNPIPSVPKAISTPRSQYIGAAPDTLINNKSISLNIKNLDITKPYIELAVISYSGLASTPTVKIVAQIPVTSETTTYTYTGLEEGSNEILSVKEINAIPTVYTNCKTLTQKDNRLFLGNVKSRVESGLQNIANNIGITYGISNIEYKEYVSNFKDDYVGEKQTFDKKTYMREEVYSFAIRFTYKDGTQSFCYHIPAPIPDSTWLNADSSNYSVNYPNNASVNTITTASNKVFNNKFYPPELLTQTNLSSIVDYNNCKLGVFINTNGYELNKNYPTTGPLNTAGIVAQRDFLMPPLDKEPSFIKIAGKQYIRLINLSISQPNFLLANNDTLTDDIISYEILRADRVQKNKTIISQGLHQKYLTYRNLDSGDLSYRESPLFGNLRVGTDSYKHLSDDDLVSWYPQNHNTALSSSLNPYDYIINEGSYSGVNGLGAGPPNVSYSYYSPDWILNNIDITEGDYIKEKLKISGNGDGGQVFNFGSVIESTGEKNSKWSIWQFMNYDSLGSGFNQNNIKILNNDTYKLNDTGFTSIDGAVVNIPINTINTVVRTVCSFPHYIITLNNNYHNNTSLLFQDTNYNDLTTGIIDIPSVNGEDIIVGTWTPTYNNSRTIINIHDDNKNPYLLIDNEYIQIANYKKTDIVTNNIIYNGDTFISKFAFKTSFNLDIAAFASANGDSGPKPRPVETFLFGGNNPIFTTSAGWAIGAVAYFFVESTVNSNYRDERGVPFYPNTDYINVLKVAVQNGHSTGYNYQYSKNNTFKIGVTSPLGFDSSGSGGFKNRIVYSEKAFESEQQDTYKIFKEGNYHDLPKNKGEIWNLFVNNNTLFAHTPKTLWRTFVNEQSAVQNAYDGSNILLGDGGMFSSTSKEVLTISGGYGGTISQFAGINTPQGYIFPDVLQSEFFILQGTQSGLQLNPISNGLNRFFNKSLNSDLFINNQNKYLDNPYNGIGLMADLDLDLNRVLYTIKNGVDNYTLSYSLNGKGSWKSFHSYIPNIYVSQNSNLLSLKNLILYKHNEGDYLKYYDEAQPKDFKVSIVIQKLGFVVIPDNLVIKQVITNNNNFVHQKTFNKIRVYNNKQNSDYYTLVANNDFNPTLLDEEILVVEKNNEVRLTIPQNSVIDDTLDVFDTTNLVTKFTQGSVNKLYRDRIKGDFVIVDLIYTPQLLENNKFTVNYIKSDIRINNF